jgi:ParB-like chromosome segregation protein Spo0J
MELSHYGVEAMPKLESFPIDKIYVPVKRKKALKPELVQEIAESILKIGQQAPILVRPDEGRFVLVEGLHRFEACKALGEKTIIGVLVSAEIVHQKTVLSDSAAAERDKMARLKRLRLEREAAARLAAASEPVTEMQSAELLRKPSETGIQNNLKAARGQLTRRTSGSTPRTLSEWLTQQKRDGGRY